MISGCCSSRVGGNKSSSFGLGGPAEAATTMGYAAMLMAATTSVPLEKNAITSSTDNMLSSRSNGMVGGAAVLLSLMVDGWYRYRRSVGS